jgi:2-octaprenyl-6-methoxyphenol hydroxylase
MNADIAIIGGGPVGSALALALKDSHLKICVLESRPANTASQDARALALSYGSRLLLERLGIWDKLPDISAIRTIHISQKQSFGRAVLQAKELKVPELGYVLPYPTLQNALTDELKNSTVQAVYGANVYQLQEESGHALIAYQQAGIAHTLRARLTVVADGGKLLAQEYPPEIHDYGQSALITHITCESAKADTAFERFTPQGPLALLPYRDGYEIVWTAPHQRVQEMLAWNDAQFLSELHQHFGDRVGAFLTVGARSHYPLGLKRAKEQSPMPYTVLLGNAAQTMHPVAGQGFNLGLRDAWDLAQEVLNAKPETLGSEEMLVSYRARRRLDREAGIHFTDGLVRLFSNNWPFINAGRAATLSALDSLPFAKKFVARRMMFGANG